MPNRQEHQQEVRNYLQQHFPTRDWTFSLPQGSGMETYFVQSNEQNYFVKVGAPTEPYLVMADIGLTPPILSYGTLESGPSIIIQPLIAGRVPSRTDYRNQLKRVAAIIHKMHNHLRLQQALDPASSNSHKDVGLQAWNALRQKWDRYKAQVPNVAEFVDLSLDELDSQIKRFSTTGLVASHNDICNANWLFAADENIYIVDLDSMSLDDPAFDIGALLWWYYPPELREQFLDIAGYRYDDEFRSRMQVRMALHCLSITLPREQSFDHFNSEHYDEALQDFRAVLGGRENPQGYTA
jgi:thiamine kinase-like enzyme